MKRIALLTVLLLVVGLSLGFAQEFKPSIAWSTAGTASLTWGVNLDTMETGFQNAGSAAMTLTLVPAVDLVKGADAPVYGEIKLSSTALTILGIVPAGFATTVTAKIVAKPIEIGITTAPTLTIGKATVIEAAAAEVVDLETVLGGGPAGAGTWVSYVSPMITLTGKLVSIGDWTRVEDTEINYAGGLDGTLVFAPVTVGFGVYTSFITAATPVAYATVALAMAPVTVGVAVDLDLAATMAYDASATIGVTLMPATTLTAVVGYGDNFNGLDAKVVFASTDLVANLSETLTVYVLDIGAVAPMMMEYEVINALTYKVALSDATSVTPSLTVKYGWNYETDDTMLLVVAGVSAALIPNTTIALTYTSGDFIVVAPATALLGTVTCAVTVAY